MAEKRLLDAKEGKGKDIKVEKIEFDAKTPPNLKQRYIFVPSHVREVYLYHLLTHPPSHPRSQVRVTSGNKGKGKARAQDDHDDDDEEEDIDEQEDLGQQVHQDDGDDDQGKQDASDDEAGASDDDDAFSVASSSSSSSHTTIDLDYSSDSSASSSGSFIDDQGSHYRRTVPTIIFVSRCQTAELLTRTLRSLSLPTISLHSHLSQSTRTANLEKFRRQATRWILVATDVASRGLDIPQVSMVVNFDLPRAWEDYIHRVGRTARAGRQGWAVSFVGERDVEIVTGIEDKIGLKLKELQMPEERVLQMLNKVSNAKREASMLLADSGFGERQKRNAEKHRKREKGARKRVKV